MSIRTIKSGFLICSSVILASCGSGGDLPQNASEEYPMPWAKASMPIYMAISKNREKCTEGYSKQRYDLSEEYLVYCYNHDRQNWTAYIVWMPSGRMLGPDITYPYTKGVPLPERDPNEVWMDSAE